MDTLISGASKLSIKLQEEQIELFSRLLNELMEWNKHTNLTAIRDREGIILKHFVDSLSVVQAIPQDARTLIDIGSGAGFPGFPLAIVLPNLNITLLESVQKKVDFLDHCVRAINLQNTRTLRARAEEAAHLPTLRESYDVAVARAVAPLNTLAEYALPFVRIGGICIAQKNAGTDETAHIESALTALGGKLESAIRIHIEGLNERQLIVIKKVKTAPAEYPRRTGLPLKSPLS